MRSLSSNDRAPHRSAGRDDGRDRARARIPGDRRPAPGGAQARHRPDGPTARLPIAALPDPRTGRPLVETFDLESACSPRFWLCCADRRRIGSRRRPRLSGREGARYERRRAQLWPGPWSSSRCHAAGPRCAVIAVGGASRALYSAGASEAAIKRLDLVPFGVVHFMTHAVVNTARPSRSATLLAPGDAREDGCCNRARSRPSTSAAARLSPAAAPTRIPGRGTARHFVSSSAPARAR